MTKYTKGDPNSIESLFDNIAPQYDKANAFMSLNLHKKWNRTLVGTLLAQGEPRQYLDLCSGTGEIALMLLKSCQQNCEAFLLDFSDQMLAIAKKKVNQNDLSHHCLHYLHADAQAIPLPSESMEAVTIAYGIRNVKNPSQCLEDAYRVLKKGGILAILELTQPKNPLIKAGHMLYMKLFLPTIGKLVASNKQAYQYLCSSIQEFLSPIELEAILKQNHFIETTIRPLSGGIATIITAKK